ncbi:hypothetical protein llap_7112 [Limosa lapponica baueri]|uniref:Uncharacterized protein n=1 Tax=Limosa lapponica baueri TaxID=1758121 RepID=A0A2I0U984_LIMLA|nr:hypothetical protein llap_7112 [Limosa lapponica baueri]
MDLGNYILMEKKPRNEAAGCCEGKSKFRQELEELFCQIETSLMSAMIRDLKICNEAMNKVYELLQVSILIDSKEKLAEWLSPALDPEAGQHHLSKGFSEAPAKLVFVIFRVRSHDHCIPTMDGDEEQYLSFMVTDREISPKRYGLGKTKYHKRDLLAC